MNSQVNLFLLPLLLAVPWSGDIFFFLFPLPFRIRHYRRTLSVYVATFAMPYTHSRTFTPQLHVKWERGVVVCYINEIFSFSPYSITVQRWILSSLSTSIREDLEQVGGTLDGGNALR